MVRLASPVAVVVENRGLTLHRVLCGAHVAKEFDHFAIDGGDVVRLSVRDQIAVDHDLLADPTAAVDSEIRLVRSWNAGVAPGVVFVGILGADALDPFSCRSTERACSRPWRVEHIRIFDRKLELERLSPVVRIDGHPVGGGQISGNMNVLAFGVLFRRDRCFVID